MRQRAHGALEVGGRDLAVVQALDETGEFAAGLHARHRLLLVAHLHDAVANAAEVEQRHVAGVVLARAWCSFGLLGARAQPARDSYALAVCLEDSCRGVTKGVQSLIG